LSSEICSLKRDLKCSRRWKFNLLDFWIVAPCSVVVGYLAYMCVSTFRSPRPSTLKMEAVRSSETLVSNYHARWRSNSQNYYLYIPWLHSRRFTSIRRTRFRVIIITIIIKLILFIECIDNGQTYSLNVRKWVSFLW
jgi:hypothetical protein